MEELIRFLAGNLEAHKAFSRDDWTQASATADDGSKVHDLCPEHLLALPDKSGFSESFIGLL